MKSRLKTAISKRIILIGIGLLALYWVLESVVTATIFDEGSFVEQLFTPDTHEAWMRFLGMGIIVAFGLYGQAVLTRRKREKGRLRTAYHFLEIANRHRRMTPMLEEFLSAVKEFSGCDSAGIRLRDREGNIPYQAYVGFSQEFYRAEGHLSIKLNQCMCINVIKGATEPKLPYYTQGGSFYTNSNSRLLATVSEAERGPNRNVCKLFGYETVVLIPINLAGRILGLIHVADHKESMVTLEKVEALEEVAIQLGTAIQRVWTEEELQESEERNRALLDLGTEVGESVVMLQDTEQGEGVQTFVSNMWPHITGYSKEELLGMSFFNLVHPENRQTSMERHRKKMAGKSMPGLYELSIVRKDGTEVPVELTSTSTTYKGQRANVVFIRDIIERKRMEEEIIQTRARAEALRVSEKMKTELLSLVSHELRTPLASIKGFASTLLQPDVRWSEEEQRDFVKEIDREADLLTRLVSDLLDMSYIDAGLLNLNKAEHKLDNVLESASGMLTKITENHKLEVKVPAELPPVLVDPGRITQVLINLIENAVKFSARGSQITIEARLADDKIITAVTDKGIGIPSKLLDKVFDRFYQAESIIAGAKNGTGLGLAICRGIVVAHGGRIWIRSKEGYGSKFSFSLPISRDDIAITKAGESIDNE